MNEFLNELPFCGAKVVLVVLVGWFYLFLRKIPRN